MTSTEEFTEVIQYWTEALAPATTVEEHLTTAIARQDFLMYALLKRAMQQNKEPAFSKWMRTHRDLAATLGSLVQTVDTLQRKRRESEPPPPPAKPSIASVGRPRKLQLVPEAVPSLEPFTRSRKRFGDPSLDLKIAA